jgi:3-hydroxyisobutyrate dehydrogenase-like beta-hydroxyacid dehydrogenase
VADAPVIAVIAIGDMGRGVAARLKAGGARVVTSLAGRGPRTAERAAAAGVEPLNDDALARQAEAVLSIVPPGAAVELAKRMAAVLARTGAHPAYVDCNAISSATMREVARIVGDAGASVLDVGIIGGPPDKSPATKFYASGPPHQALERLTALGLDVRHIGDVVGQASALKMGYGGFTKGVQALATALMVSARRAGVADALEDELAASQAPLLAMLDRLLPGMPPKAYRWVAEMEEGAASLAEAGLPPELFEGAARLYAAIAETSTAQETPIGGRTEAGRAALMDALARELPDAAPATAK